MAKKRLPICQFLWLFLSLISFVSIPVAAQPQDEICGELEVHKQKWIALNGQPQRAKQLGQSQASGDLRECLQRCCAHLDCSAVTFAGFLGPSSPSGSTNCSLFQCLNGGDDCPFVDAPEASEFGVLTVRLKRPNADVKTTAQQSSSTSIFTTIASLTTQLPLKTTASEAQRQDDRSEEEDDQLINRTWPNGEGEKGEETATNRKGQLLPKSREQDLSEEELAEWRANATRERENAGPNGHRHSLLDLGSWDQRFPLNPERTPVWAIGLAIVVTVVSLVLLMALLSSFLCYRRYRSRMRSTEISGPKKMPTLHAFNPS